MSPTTGTARTARTARTTWPRKAIALLAALAIVLFTAYSAGAYWNADNDESLEYAKTRDSVLNAGERHIARLNSMDADDVEAGLAQWLDATGGALHEELERGNDASAEVLAEVGTTTVATVTDAALLQLDTRAGTARMIASVRVETTPSSGEATTDRKRFEAGLGRTDDGWKLTSLTAITTAADES
ncbi:hypothetical protein [Streptomyces sp. NBC_01803]|uniref:hypothetical protein n=1 Tax=Streptomyces sp. NBC_01803 TaxID=2975946 RepID=UPI002DDC85CD|nr:hypothetical protein [Streptomyces sp. NBC_01803]WSA43559.1 hypothetical protein OIE51_04695 [Streptomyces sp. NBC_01803]